MSLLTVGTVAFDSIETPFGKVDKVVGGACTYISWAASYFTDNINLLSIVGNDFPEAELIELKNRGINLEGLEIIEDGKTFFWEGKYFENMNGRDTLKTDLNVLDEFNPVLPSSYTQSQYIMLGNLTPEIQNQVIDQLTNPRLIALDTMNFWMDVALEELKRAISRVDILTINDEEARQLSGEYSLVSAATKIHEMGPEYLVIKKGEHGAILFNGDKIFAIPALPLAVIKDPTGAGDTFAGGLMGYLTHANEVSFDHIKNAMVYGSAMASFCVEEFGIIKMKNLNRGQINERINQFKHLTHFEI